jgi:hypothetical protein
MRPNGKNSGRSLIGSHLSDGSSCATVCYQGRIKLNDLVWIKAGRRNKLVWSDCEWLDKAGNLVGAVIV